MTDNPCLLEPLVIEENGEVENGLVEWMQGATKTLVEEIKKPEGRKLFSKWRKLPEPTMPACNMTSALANLNRALEWSGSLGERFNALARNIIMTSVKYQKAVSGSWRNRMKKRAVCFFKYLPNRFRHKKKCRKNSFAERTLQHFPMCDADKWKICADAADVDDPLQQPESFETTM